MAEIIPIEAQEAEVLGETKSEEAKGEWVLEIVAEAEETEIEALERGTVQE